MCHLYTKFCENWLNIFCVFLLTNKLTNADENITSLAEVIMVNVQRTMFKKSIACLLHSLITAVKLIANSLLVICKSYANMIKPIEVEITEYCKCLLRLIR